MRRVAIICAASLAMVLVGGPVALAAVPSTISAAYNQQTERFHGRVTSSNAECEAGRVVKVFKKTADGRELQGKTTANGRGRWTVEVMHAHGHYVAVAPEQKIMHDRCARTASKIVDVM
jgi:hypothetical protein